MITKILKVFLIALMLELFKLLTFFSYKKMSKRVPAAGKWFTVINQAIRF
jgi:hypothetical protein